MRSAPLLAGTRSGRKKICAVSRAHWRSQVLFRKVTWHLTKREGEVLKQLALGLTNKEIAQSLGISYETVKEHVQHILQKLSVTDRTQAAVWAVRKNLV